MSKRIIDGFSEFYGYNYADSFGPNGAKTDQVGVPDFAAGAMENWGLVIYQTYLVYIKPEESYESSVLNTASGINFFERGKNIFLAVFVLPLEFQLSPMSCSISGQETS